MALIQKVGSILGMGLKTQDCHRSFDPISMANQLTGWRDVADESEYLFHTRINGRTAPVY